MAQTVIIADDLSGAADCAGAFVKAGLDTLVVIDRHAEECPGTRTAQVISVDADTRRLPADEAAAVHLELLRRYHAPGALLYKKIDSTLRGNFAQELAAILGEAERTGLAIVAPAFPQTGRVTTGGHQYLNGIPLEQTEVWRAEGIAGTAYIPTMLARHGIRTATVGMDDIRRGARHVRALLEARIADGMQAVVCDAESESDLEVIVQASLPLSVPRFWVGSAGLTAHLPGAVAMREPATATPPVTTDGSILTVVGSLSSVSRAQAEYLAAAVPMARVDVPASVLRDGRSHPRWQALRATVEASLKESRDMLVLIEKGESINMGEGLQLCQALAMLLAPLAEHIGAVVSTGGETARAILSAMGSKGLHLVGEIESGVPLSVAAGIKPIPVITKAGAFGRPDTLLRCYETLQRAREHDAADIALQDTSTPSHRKAS
ncbi:four-carbon acid sugar kinase family protein [Oxalobacteraceae bacterium OM1]|nr:four-carbon acid sugar kinase family protein [Oxalobacteraceae bacterium OM1]